MVFSATACWLGLKHISPFPLLWVSADPSHLDLHLFLLPCFGLMFTRVHMLCGRASAKEMSIKKPDISWWIVKNWGCIRIQVVVGVTELQSFFPVSVLWGLCPRLWNTERQAFQLEWTHFKGAYKSSCHGPIPQFLVLSHSLRHRATCVPARGRDITSYTQHSGSCFLCLCSLQWDLHYLLTDPGHLGFNSNRTINLIYTEQSQLLAITQMIMKTGTENPSHTWRALWRHRSVHCVNVKKKKWQECDGDWNQIFISTNFKILI